MMRCVQCDIELIAPERSEYWSDRRAYHIWLCPTCSACFESLVSFPMMGDILTEDQSLLPSLPVA